MPSPLSTRTNAIALAACAALSVSSRSASAQVKPTAIPQVEVVATRIPEAPHDVPASVEVITGKQLRDRGVRSLRDALSLATGISIAPGSDAGPAGAVPEIWGLREFDAFLLVVDDIPWGGALNPAVAALSLQDVERIEILRGPAPVTYGATSFVGVINVVHNAAAERATYLEAHGGSFGSAGGALDFVLPSKSAWKSRATIDFDKQGFQDNRTGFTRGHGLARTSNTGSRNRVWFSADLNILRQDPASPHPRQGSALSTATPLDANYNPANGYLNEDRAALFGGLEHALTGGATWRTTASFTHSSQKMFRGFLTNVANVANNASGFKEEIGINDVYADTHIILPWTRSNLRFMAGADVLGAGGEATGATFDYTVLLSGANSTLVPEPKVLDKDAGNDRLFGGAYASAEWRPARLVTLSGGLRMNLTRESRGEGASVSNTKPSGSVGAIFTLWEFNQDHVKLFGNYRNTFKPAAFDFSLAENEGVLDPETSNSYEGGFKFRGMQGRLDVEGSAFRMDFENLVTATVVNNLPALVNSGSTRFQGFELATDLRLSPAMSARASVSMHDGKFVDYVQAFDGVPTQLGGKRFEMSARKLASAGIVFAPESGIIAHASMNYTGDRYLNKRNTALAEPFSTFDAGVGYRMSSWEVRVDGRNLGNRRDAVSESEFGDAQYYRMTARTVTAGIVVRY